MTTNIIKKVSFLITLLSVSNAAEIREMHKWSYINYTWPSPLVYQYHLQIGKYVPANNFPSSIKIHGKLIFMALGRFFPGTPVTLGYINLNEKYTAPLVTPFPSWEMNVQGDCKTLQNVNAFDIDKGGVMWILDGLRHNDLTSCPAKLVLYSISSRRILSSYDFPPEGDFNGAYLTSIVADDDFAYITDSNSVDPGIIVYSRIKNKSWKLRDGSMFPNENHLKFTIGNSQYTYYQGVGPIAVSPPAANSKKARFIFYSPVSSFDMYKLNVNVIRDIDNVKGNSWRSYVHKVGSKVDQSYNYATNSNGDLYFCLLNKNALAKWNTDKSFSTASFVAQNNFINWCTGSTFDSDHIYLLSGNVGNYLITDEKPTVQKNLFRIIRIAIKK